MKTIQIDILAFKQIEGQFKMNLYINGSCIQTVMLYASDLHNLIEEGIVKPTSKDRSADSAGVLYTSAFYKLK